MLTDRYAGQELLSRGIKLRQLALLVAIEDNNTLSAAAAIMNMTQPAASRMLGDLERVMGAALTQRHTRGISLTAAGKRLAEQARTLLRDLDAAGRDVRDIESGRIGAVRLGSVSGPSLDLVVPIIRSLKLAEPNLRVNVDVGSSDHLLAELLSGRLDLYLGRVPDTADPTFLHLEPIGDEPLCLIVGHDHPLRAAAPCTLQDCLAYDWVMQASGSLMYRAVERYLLERGLQVPRSVITTDSLMLTMGFAMRSTAIGVVPAAAAQAFTQGSCERTPIARLPVAEGLAVPPYSIVTLRDRTPSAAVRTVLRLLAAQMRERRRED